MAAPPQRAGLAEPNPFATLSPIDGSPYPHLDRTPRVDGCCLTWDSRTEKSRMAKEWLQYLIDHFLRPGALARTSARPDFAAFTFDHLLNGIVAAERDDTRELWVIQCRDNEISTVQLVPPDPIPWGGPRRPNGRSVASSPNGSSPTALTSVDASHLEAAASCAAHEHPHGS